MGSIEKPTLKRIPVDAPIEEFIDAITKDGGCICTNFVSVETVEKANAEVKPWLDADKPWNGKLFPPETRRCNRLLWRSETCREKFFMHPLYQALGEHFLSSTDPTWYDQKCHYYTSHPLMSAALGIDVRPNAAGQRLHRDDKMYHTRHADATSTGWTAGRDDGFGLFVPGIKTTVENGATRMIPGSHLWGDDVGPNPDDVIYAEMDVGEAAFMFASMYHGGSTNNSKDQNRLVYALFMCKGTLRQEFATLIEYPPEVAKNFSKELQARLGYKISSPNCGMIDMRDPSFLLEDNFDHDAPNVDVDLN
ncbi:phytanoyl-CoA dioxygenase [Phlyctema vagabunda]|uniref:Phytanoyl-CoA dioxygenase n=1 Tax=Phlyctema vagabunda TaxID=108571 RepID=A0ABR4PVX4_9HELO